MNIERIRRFRPAMLLAVVLAPLAAAGQGALTISNPNWNITLTDFGYSDFLLDNTPGFEGREYLSGEWAAAVAYSAGGNPAAPKWLEPAFIFPDWTTNSNFTVVSPITETGLNADGLAIAESVITDGQLRIILRYEMIDTVVGTPMGTTAATASSAAGYLNSNRYALKQTATIQNISGASVSGLQFFQLLHGLSSQRGVYDNRTHAGPLSGFRHDITLSGIDPWSAGPVSSAAGLEDYIAFHAINAPSALEVGYYGIEGNGLDAHGIGKPSDGVHLSIESNWTGSPYSEREGRDSFQPAEPWVAGAQRWDLGSLAPSQSVSIDVLLTILTGTRVSTGPESSGSCNGGSSVPGGIDYEFEDVQTEGSCFAGFSRADESEIEVRVAEGEFSDITFPTPGRPAQLWEVGFNGDYTGTVKLVFGYDETLLPPGFDEDSLAIYHFNGGAWEMLTGAVNAAANTIPVSTATVGAFALGVDDAAVAYTIAAGVFPAGGGTVTGAGTFPGGSAITLAAAAAPGFAFTNWRENGTTVGASPALAFNVGADRTLTANFAPVGDGRVITTASLPVNGGTTAGGGAWPLNSSATVSAVAAPGYKFSKWQENGTVVSSAPNYTFTVTGDRALVAKFKPVYVIGVTVTPAAGGEVEVDAVYEMGELAKLKAVPADGYCFVNWTQNGLPVSTAANFSFNVTGNRELVAVFAPGNRIDAAAEPKNAGSVTGAGVYLNGATVVLTAEAKHGYHFTNWTEIPGQTVAGTTPEITFTSSAGRTLQANFIALPQLTAASDGAGAVTLAWPAGATGWELQENPGLVPGDWLSSPLPVTVVDGRNNVTVPASVRRRFFRLLPP